MSTKIKTIKSSTLAVMIPPKTNILFNTVTCIPSCTLPIFSILLSLKSYPFPYRTYSIKVDFTLSFRHAVNAQSLVAIPQKSISQNATSTEMDTHF